MGVAKVDSKGRRVVMGPSEQKRVVRERTQKITKILDSAPDEGGGMVKQPDGTYRGRRFSAGQLEALLNSPEIPNTVKKALKEINSIAAQDQYMNITYAAALMKNKKGQSKYKNLPISNRDGMLYDIIISPSAGTITGRLLDMSMTESRARKIYNQSADMQRVFGSEDQMFKDLHDYINALTKGEQRTAEVLGSQRKSDYLSKVLAVRNVKGNPEIPEVHLTGAARRKFESESNHPWRSFRLDRIVAMKQKEGRPILSFSESAYERAGNHFSPEPVLPIDQQPENLPVQGRLSKEQETRINELQDYYDRQTPERMKVLKADAIESMTGRLVNLGIPVRDAKKMAADTFNQALKGTKGASQVISGMGVSDLARMGGSGRPKVATRSNVNPNWLTSAFESFENDFDLAMMKAQQVGGAESKVRQVTADQGQAFVTGERLADTKAFGSSLRDDPASPPRVYSSVVEGQKYGSQGNYNVFFEWDQKTPMVVTSHHHYGVANGITDIHKSGNVGDKNARSFGDIDAEKYDTLPSGKKVLNTHLLVGNKGATTARAHQLMVATPKNGLELVGKAFRSGGSASAATALRKVMTNELIGKPSQGKTAKFTSDEGIPPVVAIQRNRTEAYVLNPDLSNVKKVTIVSNKPNEVRQLRNNIEKAFKNNSSRVPKINVVSKDSGPSGNKGRKAITDEFFKQTGQVRFAPGQQSTPEFKTWFGESKVLDESGAPLVTYSGHANVAMFGNKWDPKKATSGGFYFSEDPKIASSYAMGKMGNKEDYEGGGQYRLLDKKGNPSKKIESRDLTPAEQKKASEFLEENAGQDPAEYWKENARYDSKASKALRSGGMRRLSNIHDFLEYMGETIAYDDHDPTGKLPRAFKQTKNTFEGMLDNLGIEWNSSERSQPGVYPVYLSIKNPIDASKPFPQTVLKDLQKAAKRERVPKWKENTNTQWTKDMPLREFVEKIEAGDEYWTTQVPTKAKKIFQEHGIDGIKELGMKSAKDGVRRQTNWIAFEPSQIKSSTGNKGSFDSSKADIRFSPGKGRSKTDQEYLGAVKAEENGRIQEIVNQAAAKAGLNLEIPLFHRTWADFTAFKHGDNVESWKTGEDTRTVTGESGKAFFFGTEPTRKATPAEHSKIPGKEEKILPFYGKHKSPLVIDVDTKDWAMDVIGEGMTEFPYLITDEAVKNMKDSGYDSVHLYYGDRTAADGKPNEVLLLEPNQIKSAEPITRNDDGSIIPPSERFSDATTDFRFSPQRELNKRGGAIYTTKQGHRAIQTSSKAGVRVYDKRGRKVGGVFKSVVAAERYLSKVSE